MITCVLHACMNACTNAVHLWMEYFPFLFKFVRSIKLYYIILSSFQQIWNHNQLIDDFLGVAEVSQRGLEEATQHKLFGKGLKGKDIEMPGKLLVEITSSYDLMDL